MKKLLITACLLSPAIAHSADWVKLGEFGDEIYSVNFIDVDSITRYTSMPHIKNFWILKNYNLHKTIDDRIYRSLKNNLDLNCGTRQVRVVGAYYYEKINSTGRMIDSYENNNTSWRNILPDTEAWSYMESVCSKSELSGTDQAPGYTPPAPPSRPSPSRQSSLSTHVAKYAVGSNADLYECMDKKITIYARRLQIKDPSVYTFETLDAATKGTIKSCRKEVNAYHEGPSFNCGEAFGITQNAICATPQLRRIDVEFNNAVASAKIMTPYKTAITNNLKKWIEERDSCGSQVECIKSVYVKGMQYIEGL